MRYYVPLAAVFALLVSCSQGGEMANTSGDDVAYADENATGPAAPTDRIFCREINRRTTREDCDDLTATAQSAARGTAAFNVPAMTRGRATMIQLAISLDPPVEEGAAGNFADATGNALEPASPPPSPAPHASPPARPGRAPAEVVEELPGETEEYSPLVGRDMRAELLGQGFEIKPRSPASQVLSPGSTTTWEWEVTPQRGSDHALTIKTAVEGVMANGERVVLRSTVETRKVDVKVAWYDRLRDGLAEAPGWIKLLTGVLVALAALFAAWWALVRSARGRKDDDGGQKG